MLGFGFVNDLTKCSWFQFENDALILHIDRQLLMNSATLWHYGSRKRKKKRKIILNNIFCKLLWRSCASQSSNILEVCTFLWVILFYFISVRCTQLTGNGSHAKRTVLHDLYEKQGQSPWYDNLCRPVTDLLPLIASGVRGVTSNPAVETFFLD